jgi:hypothetical protein
MSSRLTRGGFRAFVAHPKPDHRGDLVNQLDLVSSTFACRRENDAVDKAACGLQGLAAIWVGVQARRLGRRGVQFCCENDATSLQHVEAEIGDLL